jgi:hypothetical protein
MIRILLENILLFLLPTIIYIAYRLLTREENTSSARVLDDAPLLWLFVAGAALALATLVFFGSTTGGKPGQVYVPPVLEDGKIVPGHNE